MVASKNCGIIVQLALIGALVAAQYAFPTSTYAQTVNATVLGTVVDEAGASVANAKITAKNLDTGISRETTSDEAGRYRIPELAVGRYEVTAEGKGFRPQARQGIELTVGREAGLDFKLSVGNVQEKVVIEGDATLVDTTSSTLGYLVNRKQIEELPLNGRDVLQLATLQNGVVSATAITSSQEENGPGTTRLSVNGARI